ncbi:MAG: putative LPS assembly protein LptD [Flavobacteriaceae bacterium]|nr:putative LPS assembly protein LptD [Flavobacteriaceae bacterium]
MTLINLPYGTKIGLKALQTNRQHILFGFFILLCGVFSHAQEPKKGELNITVQDSVQKLQTKPIAPQSTETEIAIDTIQKDSLTRRSFLDGIIKYKAKDYVKISRSEKKIYLFDQAEVYYQDVELKAGIIVIDYSNNEVYAGRIRQNDSLVQAPYFKQGENEVEPDSIKFNFKTKRALIWNSRSEQKNLGGGMNVFAKLTKKENDSVYYLYEGKLSTDKTFSDYYIRVRKGKFVPGKKIIAGFSNMYIADVPTPIAIPFAYFPITSNRKSGLIFPTFGENNERGYFIQNGGYYFVINDNFDLALLGDFYTNGSYGFRAESIYKKRYKYNGRFNFRYENLVTSQKGFDDYRRSSQYNIQWSHSQDSKASPNSNFSAAVNLGSSQFYTNSLNQINAGNQLNNSLNSSINYTKIFPAYPSVNLSVTAGHSQNTQTKSVNMTLPSLNASMERIFPFASKDGVKKGVLQNINFTYNLSASNQYNTTEEEFFTDKMYREGRNGVRHNIPISTNFKLFKYLSVTAGGSYEDVWAFKTIEKQDYESDKGQKIDTISGFSRFGKYNFNASLGTTIYGTWTLGKNSKLEKIRHVMRPSISWGYNPAFPETYKEYVDKNGKVVQYSPFEGGIHGVPSLYQTNSVGFSLANTLEAKVRSKDSLTDTKPRKIKLLNQLNFSTSYNMEADTLKLAPIRMTGGTSLFDGKMSLNFGATFDPYAIDNNGTRINKWNIDNGGGLARITQANANLSYGFSNKTFEKDDKKSGKVDNRNSGGREDDLFGTANDFSRQNFSDEDVNKEIENPAYNSAIPWDLRLVYTINYSNSRRQNEISSNSLMMSGNIALAPKWKIGFSSGYDFKGKGITYTQLRFERNLNSWAMNFNWVPFGGNDSWYFFIGIKGSVLSDIKWDKNRPPRRRL